MRVVRGEEEEEAAPRGGGVNKFRTTFFIVHLNDGDIIYSLNSACMFPVETVTEIDKYATIYALQHE